MAPQSKREKEEPSSSNLELSWEDLGSLSSPSREHHDSSLEVNGAWCVDRSHRLGQRFDEKNISPKDICIIDKASASSVVEAVEALNSGAISCSADACVVYSASNRCHFLLWRERCGNLPTLWARLGLSYIAASEQPHEKATLFRRSLTPTEDGNLGPSSSITRTSSLRAKAATLRGSATSPPTVQPQPCVASAGPPSFAAPSRHFSPLPDRLSSPLCRSVLGPRPSSARHPPLRACDATSESRFPTCDVPRSPQAVPSLSPRELCRGPSRNRSALPSRAGSIRTSEEQQSSFTPQSTFASPTLVSTGPSSPLQSNMTSPVSTIPRRRIAENRARSLDAPDVQSQSGLQFRFRRIPGPSRVSNGPSCQGGKSRILTPPRRALLSSCKSACVLDARSPDPQPRLLRPQQPQRQEQHGTTRAVVSKPAEINTTARGIAQRQWLPSGQIFPLRGEPQYDVEGVYTEVNASYPAALLLNQIVDEWVRIPPLALASLAWNPATLKCQLSAIIKEQTRAEPCSRASVATSRNEEDQAFAGILSNEQVWSAFERAVRRTCSDCALDNDLATKILTTVRKAISRDVEEKKETRSGSINIDTSTQTADWATLDLSPRGPWGYPNLSVPAEKKTKTSEKATSSGLQTAVVEVADLKRVSGSSSTMTTFPSTPPYGECRLRPATGRTLCRDDVHTGSNTSLANACRQIVEERFRSQSRSPSSQASSRPSSYGASRDRGNPNGAFAFPVVNPTSRSKEHAPTESLPQTTLQPREAEHHGTSLYAELCDKLQDHQLTPNTDVLDREETPSFRTEIPQQIAANSKPIEAHERAIAPRSFVETRLRSSSPAAHMNAHSEGNSQHLGRGYNGSYRVDPLRAIEGKELQAHSQLLSVNPFEIHNISQSLTRLPDENERIAGSSMSPRQMGQAEHLSGRNSPKGSRRSSPKSTPRLPGDMEGPPSSSLVQSPASLRRLADQTLAAALRLHKLPDCGRTEAFPVGARVEAHYFGEWYVGNVLDVPDGDKCSQGRYLVQCDVDEPGVYTYTKTVRMPSQAPSLVEARVGHTAATMEDPSSTSSMQNRGALSNKGLQNDGCMTTASANVGGQSSSNATQARESLRRSGGHIAAKQERGVASKRTHTRSQSPPNAPAKLGIRMNMAG